MSDYEILKKLIEDTDKLIAQDITNSSPNFNAWEFKVKKFLDRVYGVDSLEMKKFLEISFSGIWWDFEASEEQVYINYVESCRDGLNTAKAILEALLDDPVFEKIDVQFNKSTLLFIRKISSSEEEGFCFLLYEEPSHIDTGPDHK